MKDDFEEIFLRYVSKSQVRALLGEAQEAKRVEAAGGGGAIERQGNGAGEPGGVKVEKTEDGG